MRTRQQENERIDRLRPALANALEVADWPGVAGDVRDGRSLHGIARGLRELGEQESWAYEVVSCVADDGEVPSLREARAQVNGGEWRPASNGAGPRHWFLFRDAAEVSDRYHRAVNGRLIRYASHTTAQKAADRLNAAGSKA